MSKRFSFTSHFNTRKRMGAFTFISITLRLTITQSDGVNTRHSIHFKLWVWYSLHALTSIYSIGYKRSMILFLLDNPKD